MEKKHAFFSRCVGGGGTQSKPTKNPSPKKANGKLPNTGGAMLKMGTELAGGAAGFTGEVALDSGKNTVD